MSKPQIDLSNGPAPQDLVIEDLVVGEGAEAVPGGMVEVHYVGAVSYTHLTLPTILRSCRSRWSPYH